MNDPVWAGIGWKEPDRGHLGGLLSEQPVLIRNETVVAYITNIRCFPGGFLFCACVEQTFVDLDVEQPEPVVEVKFADGTTWPENPDVLGDSLLRLGGTAAGGSERYSWSFEYWVPALPPSGPTTFRIVVGQHAGNGAVDAALFRSAAERATYLWD